jgi:hypothetical protein
VQTKTPSQSGRAPAALLALLLGLLLGNAGPAFAVADFGGTALSEPRSSKAALVARSIKRDCEDDSDTGNLPPLWLGAAPHVVADHLSTRPAGGAPAAIAAEDHGRPPPPFHARAPPAA